MTQIYVDAGHATETRPPTAKPVILCDRRFCLVRDKYIDANGDLVIEVEYWRDESDYNARPTQPRAAHDHSFETRHLFGERRAVHPLEDLRWRVLDELYKYGQHEGHIAVKKRDRHAGDPYGYLSHPFVQSLEITSRE